MRRFSVALLALLVVVGLAGPWLVPFAGADAHWHDLTYWQDNPAAAPPLWLAPPGAGAAVLTAEPPEVTVLAGARKLVWLVPGVVASGDSVVTLELFGEGPLPVHVAELDGTAELLRVVAQPGPGQPARLSLSVTGPVTLVVTAFVTEGQPDPASPRVLVPGRYSGWLGTDASKRDVFTGVVLALRWALLLGVLVSLLTVILGLVLGVVAACSGGWLDSLINRVYEFFSLMPVLPLLIVLSALYQPSLWSFFVLGTLFFWTRAFKPVYAMALQIRQEEFVTASRSMGSGRLWRAFRHVLPSLLPYGFSVMALSVPGVILYEASISLLGLGDTTTVTWGQMLHDALVQGAVVSGLWWWVLPPGLMIAVTGMTFAGLSIAPRRPSMLS